MNCRVCGKDMEPAPVGPEPEELTRWVCANASCIAHHRARKCTMCGHPVVTVATSSNGARMLVCQQGHDWMDAPPREEQLELSAHESGSGV
ncbi:hypothetical protein VT84_14420 [Gemmata sp. SH-PL17]|uniref:hypothetical protein n=1 Tax=Gemmata sp. SH-PL17 TaxID=1630693 RepID=UPI00078C59DA|nr:hypothetical protein [Gemmata sp. SH-PL17]AMV25588.1 hypothetical protein VT84_14420 [Gemmata sp. SH-PL17]